MRKVAILMVSLIICLSLTSCATIKAIMYDPNNIKEEVNIETNTNILDFNSALDSDSILSSSSPSLVVLIPLFIVSIGLSVLIIMSQWKLFTKAGEKGWKSLIPLYNIWTLFKIAYGKGTRMFLIWIPFAGFVFMILFLFALADAYGKNKIGFKLGLLFLAPIFMPIMGLSKKIQYVGPKVKK